MRVFARKCEDRAARLCDRIVIGITEARFSDRCKDSKRPRQGGQRRLCDLRTGGEYWTCDHEGEVRRAKGPPREVRQAVVTGRRDHEGAGNARRRRPMAWWAFNGVSISDSPPDRLPAASELRGVVDRVVSGCCRSATANACPSPSLLVSSVSERSPTSALARSITCRWCPARREGSGAVDPDEFETGGTRVGHAQIIREGDEAAVCAG